MAHSLFHNSLYPEYNPETNSFDTFSGLGFQNKNLTPIFGQRNFGKGDLTLEEVGARQFAFGSPQGFGQASFVPTASSIFRMSNLFPSSSTGLHVGGGGGYSGVPATNASMLGL